MTLNRGAEEAAKEASINLYQRHQTDDCIQDAWAFAWKRRARCGNPIFNAPTTPIRKRKFFRSQTALDKRSATNIMAMWSSTYNKIPFG